MWLQMAIPPEPVLKATAVSSCSPIHRQAKRKARTVSPEMVIPNIRAGSSPERALQELLRETDDDIGPSASALARRIYPEVPDAARAAAVKTLKAQLAHLVELGAIAGFSE